MNKLSTRTNLEEFRGRIFQNNEKSKYQFLNKIKSKETQNFDLYEVPVGGAPGGECPGSSVAIEGSTCTPGTGGVADATVDTAADARAADATSGVVAEALFVIV